MGGRLEETFGRKCLCNALLANIGHAQIRSGGAIEPALVTVGDDLNKLARFLAPGQTTYTAADVIRILLEPPALPSQPAAFEPAASV